MGSWIDEEHRHETGRRSSKGGVGRDPADAFEVHGGQRRTRVEPVPTEPQDDTADRGDRHVVTGWHAAAVPLELAAEPRSERNGTGECDESTDRVHDRRAREVVERRLHRCEPAVRTPDPVAEDRVDEPTHRDAVEQVATEGGTSDHRTGRDRAAGVGEGVLEQEERQERDARRSVGVRRAVQEEVLVTDPLVAGAEHERETERPEQQCAQAGVGDTRDHDVGDFAGSCEPGLQEHEPGLHEEHEERRDQHPHGVHRVDDVVGLRSPASSGRASWRPPWY